MGARWIVLAALSMATAVTRAQELEKLSLDDPSSVSPMIEADARVKAEGASSLKITTRWPATVCLGEVAGPDIEDARLVYAARVKSELDGTAFLEMWAHVGGGQYFSKGLNDVVSQQTDWKTIRTVFDFRSGERPDKVTLNLVINGTGTVWVDDVVLSGEPLP